MSEPEPKHDRVLNRVHLWVAILGGVLTLAIGIFNFKSMLFPARSVSHPAAESRADVGREVSTAPVTEEPLSFESFRSFDQNGDGKVHQSEWRGAPEDFYLFDLDGNGVLAAQDLRGVNFEDMDRNGDGYIAALEWRKARRAFDLFDADGDKRISREEFAIREKARRSLS